MDYYSSLFASKLNGGGGGGGGQWTTDGIAQSLEPNGDIVLGNEVTQIGNYAFMGKPIVSINTNNVTHIGISALGLCANLTNVSFPNVASIGGRFFDDCKIEKLIMPKLASIANSTMPFGGSHQLKILVLPSVTSIGYNNFTGNQSLNTLDLGEQFSNIGRNTLNGTGSLDCLILRKKDGVVSVDASTMNSTKFKDGSTGGTLYVPNALISSYQSATNWSTILGYANNQIKAIEGSIYENAYADGTPIS